MLLLLWNTLSFAQLSQKDFNTIMRDLSAMMNQIAPIPMDGGVGTVDAFSYENSIFSMSMTTREGAMDFSQMRDYEEVIVKRQSVAVRYLLESMWDELLDDNDWLEPSYDKLFDYFKGAQMTFVEENTHRGYNLFLSSADLKAANHLDIDDEDNLSQELENSVVGVGQLEALSKEFELFSAQNLPLELSEGLFLNDIAFEDNNMVYRFSVDAAFQNNDSALVRRDILERIIRPNNAQTQELVEYVGALGVGIVFAMQFTDRLITFRVAPEELNQNVKIADAAMLRDRLEVYCREINAMTPIALDPITSLDSARLEEGQMMICHSINASISFDLGSEEIRRSVHMNNQLSLNSANHLQINMFELLVSLNMDLVYYYVNVADGKTLIDRFTVEDLKAVIDQKRQF